MAKKTRFSAYGSLHEQVRQDLLDRILAGEYRYGDRLPPEDELCQYYGVSRITVRRAVSELAAQFIVVRRRGVGTEVTFRSSNRRVFRLSGFFENNSLFQHDLHFEKTIEADENLAKIFDCPVGTPVVHRRVVTHLDKKRFTLAEIYSRGDSKNWSLGHRIERAEQEITAELADETVFECLGLAVGTPMLAARRTYYTAGNERVRYLYSRYHPENYRFLVDLQPGSGQPMFESNITPPDMR
ncbi:XRE family transcriptional regulator [Nitratireductor aestuarii]|uniref:XRE family transcriptional regulator n=1 Tax=Nitratireductor aestuarii TaxID=1735103 RepID=A0A916RRR0_9HYPH|nr:GntR family transcriptional regulator [Nitratireductor aestuarii]GGA66465.1 XRE family transcriptional regulator [Nitratireductor aestuarii]